MIRRLVPGIVVSGHNITSAALLAEAAVAGSLSDAALDGSQERHPAMATGLTILEVTDAN